MLREIDRALRWAAAVVVVVMTMMMAAAAAAPPTTTAPVKAFTSAHKMLRPPAEVAYGVRFGPK